MRYISVCSGIEAATVAWHPLGWMPAAFAEIEPFPCTVLAHHYPGVPNVGDFTAIQGDEFGPVDVLVAGTPCQDFSVAGLRAGMDGKRGQLTVELAYLAGRLRPRWLVWENVPGILSIDRGRAFGTFLGLMGQLGYGFAYRVLDAQFFGVPQRRRRVFVVGHIGDWRRAAAVLFERHSLSGHPPPRREAGQSAPTIRSRRTGGGGLGTDFDCDCDGALIANTLLSGGKGHGRNPLDETLIAHSLLAKGNCSFDSTREIYVHVTHSICANGFDASEDGTGRGTPLVPVGGRNGGGMPEMDEVASLRAASGGSIRSHVAFANQGSRIQEVDGAAGTVSCNPHGGTRIDPVRVGMAVRRLTPLECERLQGFPDDYTLVAYRGKPMADGPRYKMLGNSMAVPVMRWIGERIQIVEELTHD